MSFLIIGVRVCERVYILLVGGIGIEGGELF
jgi:hypothetical protein